MTYQFRLLSEIIDDIQYRGNLAGYDQRHPEATLKILWNASWQELREIVSFAEDGTFLQQTTPASLPTTPATSEDYVVVDWPVNAVAIFGVRVKTNERWRPLKSLPASALHDYQYDGLFGTTARNPIGYILKTIPFGASATETAGKIMIVPVPTSGTYSVWYLEAWSPVTTDAHTVSGHAAWVEHSIWSTIVKARAADGQQDDTYQIAFKERDRVEERIIERARRLSEGMSQEPRDARGDGWEPNPYDWND